MSKPTKTTNRLHFSDLDPIRFEDLCLALIYPLHSWNDIRHYGRKGNDNGIDIFAVENLENGSQRNWIVQCKRYAQASKSDLIQAVDAALDKNNIVPDVFLLIITCDLSRKTHEAYEKYAYQNHISTPILWTQSILEAKLYSERPDLLFSYFSISTAQQSREREMRIRRNIALKKRIQKELLTASINPKDRLTLPNKRFCSSEAIIHSIDDTTYPASPEDADLTTAGWFKLEFWNSYYNGLEFILGVRYALINLNNKWAIVPQDKEFDESIFHKVTVWHIGRIPFKNIIEIDVEGDEFYPFPHIYCIFSELGQPYEEHVYHLTDKNYLTLLPEDQLTYEELVNQQQQ